MHRCSILLPLLIFGLLYPSGFLMDVREAFAVENVPAKGRGTNVVDRFIQVSGQKIRYRETGGGEPNIILLHGFGGRLETWNALREHLSCGRVISLDLIGFGESSRPRLSYTLETHRMFLLKFMEALGIDDAVLIGFSMGASVAAWTASRSPDKVRACILFAPSGYPGSLRHGYPARLFYRPGVPNLIGKFVARTWAYRKLFPSSIAVQALDVTASYDESFAEALKGIRQPVLVFWGRGDRKVPFSYSEEYIKRIPRSSLSERPLSVGHSGVVKYDPSATAEEICRFLNRRPINFPKEETQ